jgi:Cu2+-exporting ATPase
MTAACRHCGQPLASADRTGFCCNGCKNAYALVEGLGLARFYDRIAAAGVTALRPDADAPIADFASFIEDAADGSRTLNLMVEGVHCGACVWLIESVLARDQAVLDARLNLTTRRLTLSWRGQGDAQADALARLRPVIALGYRLAPYAALKADRASADDARLLRALAVAGFAAANVMLLSVAIWAGHAQGMGPATRDLMHGLSALIALPAIAYAGRPFFGSAITVLRAGRVNMDVPISLGVLLAAAVSIAETVAGGAHAYFDSAITLLFFLLVGRYLDARARGRARERVQNLALLGTGAVTVLEPDGTRRLLAPGRVQAGMRILVAAGERIGVDGVIEAGESALDLSPITGESVPVAVSPGQSVLAGALNLGQPLTIRTQAAGEATVLADIARRFEDAIKGRGRYVALADRVARHYAPVVHVTALVTFAGWLAAGTEWTDALLIAVSVLIVTCPCALALAVPAVNVMAVSRLMRLGILIKDATALERLADATHAAFDKTGTLTVGRPELLNADTIAAPVLERAAGLAAASRHPLARALVRAAEQRGIAVSAHDGVREHTGRGLERTGAAGTERLGSRAFVAAVTDTALAYGGTGKAGDDGYSELWLAAPDAPPVRFAFADAPRADAAATVARIAAAGLTVSILSGDRGPVVERIARALAVADWRAELAPAAKQQVLDGLKAKGARVLMVGDGLNDAPALAAAHVSMSPAGASDLSRAAADLLFQGDRLAPVAVAIGVARDARRLARQNLVFALVYNAFAVPLAVAGLVTPLIAAVAMSSSSLCVLLNALRLGRARTEFDSTDRAPEPATDASPSAAPVAVRT